MKMMTPSHCIGCSAKDPRIKQDCILCELPSEPYGHRLPAGSFLPLMTPAMFDEHTFAPPSLMRIASSCTVKIPVKHLKLGSVLHPILSD